FGGNGNSTIYNYMAGGGGTGSTGTLTIGPGITIRGKFGQIYNNAPQGRFINQGKISADGSGGVIVFGNNNGQYTSTGTLETKNGASLNLGGSWNSTGGTVSVNGGTLNLGGTFTQASLRTFNRT